MKLPCPNLQLKRTHMFGAILYLHPPQSFFRIPHAQIWPLALGRVGTCPQPRPMLLIRSSTATSLFARNNNAYLLLLLGTSIQN